MGGATPNLSLRVMSSFTGPLPLRSLPHSHLPGKGRLTKPPHKALAVCWKELQKGNVKGATAVLSSAEKREGPRRWEWVVHRAGCGCGDGEQPPVALPTDTSDPQLQQGREHR